MEKLKKWIGKLTDAFKLSGIPFILGFLGAFAGSEGTSKNWRRILIPIIFTICALIELKNLWVILLMIQSACLSMGYGIPGGNDEGSTLGRFFYKLFKQNHLIADIFTRGTIGTLISLSFLVIPILKGNWLIWGLGSLGIILVYVLISWRGFGEVILKWKNTTYMLLKVDFITYSILGILGLMVIYK